MFILLEKLDSSGSNSTPHPGKVQILHLPALYLSLLSCKKIQLGDVTWISKKQIQAIMHYPKKKKILRKVSGSVCYAIFHKFFFNQSIDHSLLYSLLLKNKLQQWKF